MITNHATFFRTHPDLKDFPFDQGNKASRDKAAEQANAHIAARRKAIEAKAGGSISDSEYFSNAVTHTEDRSPLEQSKKFKAVTKEPGRHDALKADIQRQIEERDVMKMGTLERRLYDIERLESEQAEQQAQEQAREAHFKNPVVATALAELNKVLDEMRWDRTRKRSEVVRIEQAIEQWSHPDGCQATAGAMTKDVLDLEDARAELLNSATVDQIKALEATLTNPRNSQSLRFEVDRTASLEDQSARLFDAIFDSPASPWELKEQIHAANRAMDDGDDSAIRSLIDQYTVGENQTLPAE